MLRVVYICTQTHTHTYGCILCDGFHYASVEWMGNSLKISTHTSKKKPFLCCCFIYLPYNLFSFLEHAKSVTHVNLYIFVFLFLFFMCINIHSVVFFTVPWIFGFDCITLHLPLWTNRTKSNRTVTITDKWYSSILYKKSRASDSSGWHGI